MTSRSDRGWLAACLCLAALAAWLYCEVRGARPALVTWRVELAPDSLEVAGTLRERAPHLLGGGPILESSSPGGRLDVLALEARGGGRARRVDVAASRAGTRATLERGAAELAFRVPGTGYLVRDHVAFAYCDAPRRAVALPAARFFFAADSATELASDSVNAPRLEPDLWERGLFVAGDGWLRSDADPRIDVVRLSDDRAGHAELAARRLSAALERLERCGVPAPRRRPVALVLPSAAGAATVEFELAAASEIYVVELGAREPSASTFRDLARAAAARMARARPRDEAREWLTIARYLALALEDDAAPGAFERELARVRRTYEATAPVSVVLAEAEVSGDDLGWLVEEVIAPAAWDELARALDPGGPRRAWTLVAAAMEREHRSEGIERWLARRAGSEAAALHRRLFRAPGFHVRSASTAERDGFPFAPPPRFPDAWRGRRERIELVMSSMSLGFLDNCGCSLSQEGGMPRRASAIAAERARASDLVAVELGDFLAPPFSDLSRPRSHAEAMLDALDACAYDAIVPGIADLSADADWFAAQAAARGLPITAVNVRARSSGARPFAGAIRLARGAADVHVVGIVEVAWERFRREAVDKTALAQYELEDAYAALAAELAGAREADVWIVAGTLTPDTVARLLASPLASHVDAILTTSARTAVELPERSTSERMALLQTAQVGCYGSTFYAYPLLERFGLTRSTIELDDGRAVAGVSAGIRLRASVPKDARVEALLAELARREAGDPSTWVASPLAALDAPSGPAPYAGAAACGACHPRELEHWRSSGHALAMSALASRAREFDPACLRCHTTGFLIGGFDPRDAASRRFENVQCEVCHGPGAEHAAGHASGDGTGPPLRRTPPEALCVSCHDADNSPHFQYAEFAERVRHADGAPAPR